MKLVKWWNGGVVSRLNLYGLGAVIFVALFVEIAMPQTWVQKVPANGLGNSLAVNPLNSNVLYGSPGNTRVYVSHDRGYSWELYGNAIPVVGVQPNIIKSVAVSPNDTLQILVGVETSGADPDRIYKTTNGGLSWIETWAGSFYYYGRPVEFKPQHPDTVYTMGNDTLWRSTDFGSTWDTVTVRRNGDFNAWCDAEVRIDSSNIMFLGDAGTGIWKSTDYGASWKKVYTAISSGEIPSIAIDPFNQQVMYATRFSGGGGVLKSTNGGETWAAITTPVGISSTWWITCSTVNPGYVYFGVYFTGSSAGIFLSRDSGSSWENLSAGFSSSAKFNYGLLALDSLTVVALQQTGIYRLQYTPSIHILSPNGGELYSSGAHHTISWTATNLYAVRLEYSSNNGGSWQTLQDSIPSFQTSYDWVVPSVVSSQYRVRVSDRLYTTASDVSDTTFSVVPLQVTVPNGGEQWSSGSYQTISWSQNEYTDISLYYSTNSGSSWNYITKVLSPGHQYQWLVPEGISSSSCKIKVTNDADTTVNDASDGVFGISTHSSFRARLRFSDGGLHTDSLLFATAGGATDGIDSSFGEVELPSKPSSGTFDIRWHIASTNGTMVDYRDTLSDGGQQNIYFAELQPGPGGYPFLVSWDPDSLESGTYELRDSLTNGGIVRVDMRRQNSVTISDPSVGVLEIIECPSVVVAYAGAGDWNLVSLPFNLPDRRKQSVFPYSRSEAFAFIGSYVSRETLQTGIGYWLKLEQTSIAGCPHTADTVPVAKGWNMIGSLTQPIDVSSIVTVPESIVSSNYFAYSGSYAVATTLVPGGGYWVKTNSSGTLYLTGASAIQKVSSVKASFANLHSLTVGDGEGHSQTLYFGANDGSLLPDRFELPPRPPGNLFDVRFISQRMVELHQKNLQNEVELAIAITSERPEIFFAWGVENDENFSYILKEYSDARETVCKILAGRGSLHFGHNSKSSFSLVVRQNSGSAERPRQYALDELYPNPFNPTTHVRFSLPEDAFVKVIVYSTLGEEVAVIVDGFRVTGSHEAEWNGTRGDGSSLASGMYFVRMSARSASDKENAHRQAFSEVRKVLLLK